MHIENPKYNSINLAIISLEHFFFIIIGNNLQLDHNCVCINCMHVGSLFYSITATRTKRIRMKKKKTEYNNIKN